MLVSGAGDISIAAVAMLHVLRLALDKLFPMVYREIKVSVQEGT